MAFLEKRILKKIMTHPSLTEKPPVFIDIGASGKINFKWKELAPYAICIAFDADDRDFNIKEINNSAYRKLYLFNCIVSDLEIEKADFYLTQSPHCSSALEPAYSRLDQWEFQDLFKTKSRIQIKNISLEKVLNDLEIDYVDWFKTDSQGIDLRIFKTLKQAVIEKTLIAEFEPGIIDSYNNEDKLWQILSYMDSLPFFMSDINVKGTIRMDKDLRIRLGEKSRLSIVRNSPCWAEITYLNEMTNIGFAKRDYLLSYITACIEEQHGFAYSVSNKALELFDDPLFEELSALAYKKASKRKSYFHLFKDLLFKKFFKKHILS